MNIALYDPYRGKFTADMIAWWQAHGHEVRTDPKGEYDPKLAEWADVVWFDTCSNNLISATNPDAALLADGANYSPWRLQDMNKKKVIVRAIDIDIWSGHHASVKWDIVDDCIFIAPHIRNLMMLDSRPNDSAMRLHTIPAGVNLERYSFKPRRPGFKIAVVAERWVSKGVSEVIQIALRLKQIDPRYKIHWLGKNNDYHWEQAYLLDMIKRNDLPIVLEEDYVEDLDAWLENKNYILSASHKEAFGYSIAEAMAKGIRPLIHHFYGAEHIWPGLTWQGIDEVIDMITDGTYDSEGYRQYLLDHHLDLTSMMEGFDGIIHS